jgi:hypothetical protein
MDLPNRISRLSYTGLEQVCFMPLTHGQNTPTLNFGPRLLIMLSGYSTASLPLMLAPAQTSCGPKQNVPCKDFNHALVFVCLVYILDPKLQDGHKILKWDPWAHLGMFVGFSYIHSLLVPLVLNVSTGKISPHYHVIFENLLRLFRPFLWVIPFNSSGIGSSSFFVNVIWMLISSRCGFPILDSVTNDHFTSLPLPLELPLRSLSYNNHTDLPFFPPAGNATNVPARAPKGDPEGALVDNLAGIQMSTP